MGGIPMKPTYLIAAEIARDYYLSIGISEAHAITWQFFWIRSIQLSELVVISYALANDLH